ncbi:YCII-related domain protein [Aspergillus sclerotialis]|uniref:YCII-related domain protein n=1 Tax=Aspergillus sclerotialis TaxID=2070753 RepID=A0A3A3A209_9EURO|nr:YCII-related domain protein [Aspergillus sclerotialis]
MPHPQFQSLRTLVSHPAISRTTTHALRRQAALLPASFLLRPRQHRYYSSSLSSNFRNPISSFSSPFTLNYRSMSSSPSTRKEFLCIVPDKPGTVSKRVEVRGSHLEGVKPLVEKGDIVIGGAMFDSHPVEGETPSFKGSMLVAAGENIDQVKEMLARDVYTTSGVWDLENATIVPFRTAVKTSL